MGGPSYPYRGRAIMKYKPPPQPGHSAEQAAQQFAFAKGDTVTVTGQADDEGDWLEGEKDGVQGVFPAGFVEPLEEEENAASSEDAVVDCGTASSASPAAQAALSSPSTVEATPSDPTNVVEAQQDSAPVSPPKQDTTLREPESAVEKPTLADVTPKSAEPAHESAAAAPTSPTKATAAGESDGTTTKAHPPPPARKPNALASRIAAFNAAASAHAAEPPVPRPKPKQWRPPTVAAAVPAPAQPKSATSLKSPTSDLPAAHTTEARSPTAHIASDGGEEHAAGAERREFSAEDAQESISRGGGSLRDRIKALQGGGAGGLGARVDPGAKPWKKHASTDESVPAESSAPTTATDADPIESIEPINLQHPEENLRDAVVLDSPPAIEHRTAEEPQSDIPGFEPAEEDDDDVPSAPSVTVASADDTPEPTQTSTTTSAAESATSSTDQSAEATEGQRVGLPMPALPKRAAPPRARKAKSPAAAVPASANPMENVVTSSDALAAATSAAEESRSTGAEKETTLPQDDVLTSMGGASKLLAADDDDDETERSKVVPVDEDDFETPAAPPAAPTSRPPVPPTQRSFDEPHLEEGEEEINVAQYSPRDDDVPQRTIAEEAVDALPSTDEPAVEEAAPLSPTAGRPPLPPPFVRQVTEQNDEVDAAAAGKTDNDEAPKVPPARQPPIPTHQPPPGEESITTAAEDAYLNKMPDILTPPEEAADESTAAPELNAPTTETIAQTRHEAGHHPAEMAQPTFGKMEGTATPAVERSPPLLAQRNVTGIAGQLAQPPSHHEGSEQAGGATEAADDDDEEEEEEEEDPEIARRRALAARMAKLGGRGPLMGGPMLGFGGLPPKKPAKKKSTAESADAAAQAPVPRIESQVVDPESDSGHTTPDHPPRRVGGPPIGGFALPGIATARPPQEHDDAPQQQEVECPAEPPKLDKNDKIALSGDELASRSAAATDKAFVIADEKREAEARTEDATAEGEEGTQEEEAAEEEAEAPPPRPATRPPTLPPTRSVPPPVEQDVEDTEEAGELQPSYIQEQDQHSAEPESYAQADDQQEEGSEQAAAEDDDMPPPPPPPRPAGGHQASMPLPEPEVPTSPPLRAIPATPPTHPAPPPPEIAALERSATLSSQRSASTSGGAASLGGAISPRQSVDVQFSPSRMQGGAAIPGAFLAKDLDLDTALPWWRTPGGVPRSLQGRFDIFVDTSEKSISERGTIEKEIEVIYSDYSKTLITVSYAADDPAEVSTAISQVHFPPAMKPNLDALLQWSASLGAQMFAAAHTKMSDKSARGLSDYDLLRFCFGRATDPLLPVGTTFGVKVYEATVEHGQKHPMVGEDDEPRAGDVVSIYAKFKHNLSTKTVGSEAHGPHLGIVAAWEPKKGKLKVIEVEGKNGSVDENAYRVDEMRAGSLIVYRVAPRDFIV